MARNRGFYKGSKVICSEGGVIGIVLSFYTPTSCEEQTKVRTNDGREYHAPTRTWKLYTDGLTPTNISYDEFKFENSLPYDDSTIIVPKMTDSTEFAKYEKKTMDEIYKAFGLPPEVFNRD